MKTVLLAEAQRRFEAGDEWWRENRDVKDLFVDEFAQTLERLTTHVYYFHDPDQDLVEIHTVWGAHRERGPSV